MIGLLHTAQAHVASFEALVREFDVDVATRHLVREDLLATARSAAPAGPELARAVREAIRSLGEMGAQVVLCTCSTIGALAESASEASCKVVRIDRPAVELALASGRRLLIVAALPSALDQTLELVQSAAIARELRPAIATTLCSAAWSHFERGENEEYLRCVARAVDAYATADDQVLLAQASMAGATKYVRPNGAHILSTPRPAVEAAIAAHHAARAQARL